jgi:hypothetical protein
VDDRHPGQPLGDPRRQTLRVLGHQFDQLLA